MKATPDPTTFRKKRKQTGLAALDAPNKGFAKVLKRPSAACQVTEAFETSSAWQTRLKGTKLW